MSPAERPRERLAVFGSDSLADVELVALVLGGGHALERALSVLASVGGLLGLAEATPTELARIPGVGQAGASALASACALARRLADRRVPFTDAVRNPAEVAAFARVRFGGEPQETFALLGLDARHRVRLVQVVAVGTLAQVDVHPREVFRPLVRNGMHAVVLVHNHPSGDPTPSDADIELTRRLVEVGELVGIPVIDHVVVARGGYTSLTSEGLMV